MTKKVKRDLQEKRLFPWLDKGIEYGFYLLFFTVPLYFNIVNTTSPFEFNKILLVYGFCAIITGIWVIKILLEKKMILRSTPLDIPILLFLLVLLLSTLFSTYVPVSLWGKQTMPMGALFPTLALILLYYAFINNMQDQEKLDNTLYVLVAAGVITAIYGFFQHFGIDFIPWSTQFLSRSFGTIGQANGLAAFLGALSPLLFLSIFTTKSPILRGIWGTLWLLLLICILFTASRSGLLGLAIGLIFLLFWILLYSIKTKEIKPFLLTLSIFGVLSVMAVSFYFYTSTLVQGKTQISQTLEVGSLESSASTRMLVWQGAIHIWQKHPLLGSGPETFGDQYNLVRLQKHNVSGGWNLLFTKAHNEFLHILATTGTLGIITYLLMILVFLGWVGYQGFKMINSPSLPSPKEFLLPLALAAGYLDLLVTNFFGFSWVPIALLLYLFPAIAINGYGLLSKEAPKTRTWPLTVGPLLQKGSLLAALVILCLILSAEAVVWNADILYNKAENQLRATSNLSASEQYLKEAINLNPWDADYHSRLARIDAMIAQVLKNNYQNPNEAEKYKNLALHESDRSVALSPYREDLWRERAVTYNILSKVDPSLKLVPFDSMQRAIALYPNNPINYYYLSLLLEDEKETDRSLEAMKQALELKPDFYDARLALTVRYYEMAKRTEATQSLESLLALKPGKDKENNLLALAKEAEKKGDSAGAATITRYLEELDKLP